MSTKSILLIIAIIGTSLLLLIGCTKSQPSGYAAYQGQQQGQGVIGGGCGVTAPAVDTSTAEQLLTYNAESA